MTRQVCGDCDGEIFRDIELDEDEIGATVTLECRCTEINIDLIAEPIDIDEYPTGWRREKALL